MAGPNYFSRFKAGEYVFKENDEGSEMFVIEQGRVDIVRTINDQELIVAALEQGDFFGEMSILEGTPREASARASTDLKVLRIDGAAFDHMLTQSPEISVRMLRKLTRKLRDAQLAAAVAQRNAAEGKLKAREMPAPAPAAAEPPPPKPHAPAPVETPAEPPAAPPVKPAPATIESREVHAEPPVPKITIRTTDDDSSASLKRRPGKSKPAEAEPEPAMSPAAAAILQKPEPGEGTRSKKSAKAAAPASPGKLVEEGTGQEFPLNPGELTTIGRFDSVSGNRPDIDLSGADKTRSISRKHAKIIRDGDRLFVTEDVGTANGTFVNGQRIRTGIRTEIKAGDKVRFGGVKTVLEF